MVHPNPSLTPTKKIVDDLSSIDMEVNISKTEVISFCTESRKSFIHSQKNVKIVPVGDSELHGFPLFTGSARRNLNNNNNNNNNNGYF